MFWWHGRQLPDPTKPSCSVLVALWGPSADRTWALPSLRQDDSPRQNTKPTAARSAPRWRRADRQRGGELWSPIGGSPFSARIVKLANEQCKRHLAPSAGLARAGQKSSPPPFGPYPPLQTARTLERSKLHMSAYN